MEYKNDTVIYGKDCKKPTFKEEHFNSDETTTESQTSHVQQNDKHLVKYVENSDMDSKAGILQETLDPNATSTTINSNPKQSFTCLGIATMKGDNEIDIKEEHVYQNKVSPESQKLHSLKYETYFMEYRVRVDEDTKVGIKKEVWNPNGVSSDKYDREQPPTLDPGPFIGPGTIKDSDEKDNKEALWCSEEIAADTLSEREGIGSKKNEKAEVVPLLQSLGLHTDTACSSSASQKQESKNRCSFSAKTSLSAQTCESKHRCKACGKSFKLQSCLKKHDLVSKECKQRNLDKNCTHSGVLKDHVILSNRRQYKCDTCGKTFSHLGHFNEHQLVHSDRRQHKCQICGKCFKQLAGLKAHLLVHNDKRQFKCQICEKSFKRLSVLKSHLLVHDDKRRHKCQICEKTFKQSAHLKSHLLVHHDKRQFKCEICATTFKRFAHLKTHLLVHDDKRQHRCQICKKSFNHLHVLKSHLLVHGDKRQYKCQICEKSFKRLDYLKSHLLVHDDKRHYKCQVCEKSFKQLPSLRKHLLVHDDKRHYKCQTCQKSFKQLPGLKTHLLVHDDTKQFKCEICATTFKRLDSLKMHLLVHDDNRKFKCEICAKGFKRLFSLKRHLLIHSEKCNKSASYVQKD